MNEIDIGRNDTQPRTVEQQKQLEDKQDVTKSPHHAIPAIDFTSNPVMFRRPRVIGSTKPRPHYKTMFETLLRHHNRLQVILVVVVVGSVIASGIMLHNIYQLKNGLKAQQAWIESMQLNGMKVGKY